MRFVDTHLPALAENLALDEALLESAERGWHHEEVLRVWNAQSTFVVVGRSSRVEAEVQREVAERLQVPILRRVSGGTSIVASRGCMFYAVLLDLEKRPQLRMLDAAHQYVMKHLIWAIQPYRADIRLLGNCDLVVDAASANPPAGLALKVSGNSLRVCRRWMLYHGTLLLDMQLDLVGQLLKHPPREPEYRAGRTHADFLANLGIEAGTLRDSLRRVWRADAMLVEPPWVLMRELVEQRYGQRSWNFQR